MVVAAPIASSASFLLLFLRWKGATSFAESLYIVLAGLGNGITMQAIFIFLSAGIKKSENSIAGGGFYLSSSLGEVTGMSCQSAILQAMVRRIQVQELGGADAAAKVRPFADRPFYLSSLMCPFLCFLTSGSRRVSNQFPLDHRRGHRERQSYLDTPVTDPDRRRKRLRARFEMYISCVFFRTLLFPPYVS